MGVQDVPRGVRLPVEIDERLDRLASATGRFKSFYLRSLMTEGVDRLEWECGILSDLVEYRAGRLETVSNEDLKVDLGLSD